MANVHNLPGSTGPSKNRRPAGMIWVLATLVLALIVAALVWVLVLGRNGQPAASAPTTTPAATTNAPVITPSTGTSSPTSVPATPALGASWADAGCNGTQGTAASPATELAAATWSPFLTAALPSSPTLGPVKTDGSIRKCYQHSPAGAVMAAANFALAPLGPDGRNVVETQWTSGPGKQDMLSALASWSGTTGRIAGYHIAACTATTCNVELIVFGSGQYAQSVMPLVWRDGDWKVDGSLNMASPGLVATIPPGFSAWGVS